MDNPLGILLGQGLHTVSFVMDYVELHFDDSVLRALTDPIVRVGLDEVRFPANGSRDSLCQLIGEKVVRADIRENDAIEVQFGSGARIVIPLNQPIPTSGESAHFMPTGEGQITIW